jgi:hypothetical protein
VKTITDPSLLDDFLLLLEAKRSYIGRARECRCGYAGRYFETKSAVKAQAERIRRLVAEGHVAEIGPGYIDVNVGNRAYALYSH